MEENNIYDPGSDRSSTVFDKIDTKVKDLYNIRYNIITNCIEITVKNKKDWEIINDSSLYINLKQRKLKATKADLDTYLGSYYVPKYNPVKAFVKSLPKWDGQDHINKLCSLIKTEDDPEFLTQIRKWLVRTIICILNDDYFNKQCFVFVSKKESLGKTSLARWLLPKAIKFYSAENIDNSKDGLIALSASAIILLDELDLIPLKDLKFYKTAISKTTVSIRPPFGKRVVSAPRICSFLGTTNSYNFLNSGQGNIRWVCFEIFNIDFSYSKIIDINKVWAQAYFLSQQSGFDYEMSHSEIKKNNLKNSKYKMSNWYEDTINQFYIKSKNKNDFFTASQLVQIHINDNPKANSVGMGKALNELGYERIKFRGVYGYLIRGLKNEEH